MRYFLLSLALSLRVRLRSVRFWLMLLLALSAGLALRWTLRPAAASGAVRVGVVLADGGEAFWDALTSRGGSIVEFIPTDEPTARVKVSSSRWDCALILPDGFSDRLDASGLAEPIVLLTGPGSTVYPLVRETAAAAVLELVTAQIAADYLLSSGIAEETALGTLPQPRSVQIEMETLTGLPLDGIKLAEESYSRIFRGVIAAALLVWTLFAAVDLGRWQETGAARRMRPGLGYVRLALPRLLAEMLAAFVLGMAGLLASGALPGLAGVLALVLYLSALAAPALLAAAFRPVWNALPALIPFAAASVFVLSPVFVDMALFFPQLSTLSQWLPVTLFLQGGEGSIAALARLAAVAAVLAAAAALPDLVPRYKKK